MLKGADCGTFGLSLSWKSALGMAEAKPNGRDQDESDVREEELHFTRVMNTFRLYKKHSLMQIARCEKNYEALPQCHKDLVPDHTETLNRMRVCVEQNNAILLEILKNCGGTFQNKAYEETFEDVAATRPRPMDMDKMKTTLKQIVRDWSADGQSERDQSYRPIIEEVAARMPTRIGEERRMTRILVPGCGLGRLAWEFARLGYACEGNEFSFFMLFVSNFILNRTPYSSESEFHQFTIHPWVAQRCNVASWESVLKPVKFPDINPAILPPASCFSMSAGDFLECYEEEASWDCVATCYFIDTAHNIIAYLERIYRILIPGGLWVNLGPLLFHYADLPNEPSVEFSYEQVVNIAKKVGFHILKDERGLDSTYVNNPESMLQYTYKCGLLVAVKPGPSST